VVVQVTPVSLLASAAVCGPNGNSPCDPRGLGISPSVKAQLALMPAPNLAGGDGLNTGSYLANLPTPTQTDYGVIRLDHTITSKLTFNGNYTYFRSIATGNGDISIANGQPHSVIHQSGCSRPAFGSFENGYWL